MSKSSQNARLTVPGELNAALAPPHFAVANGARESELLLLCARSTLDADAEARVRTIVSDRVDWDVVITRAHHHRVLPLLSRSLTRTVPNGVPDAAVRRLRDASFANARRNLLLTRELLGIVDLLRSEGIDSIPYKGPVLAARIYGDIALRQFADLDLIVPAKDVVRAREILLSRGYDDERPTTAQDLLASIGGEEKHIGLLHNDLGIDLEVHWGLSTTDDPIQLPIELVWEELTDCSLAGRCIPAPRCERLLLIQCVHGAKHRWERLGWICDVAEIVRTRPGLDWKLVVEDAARLNGRRILLLGLMLARDLLGAEPPAHIVDEIERDADLVPLSKIVWARLATEDLLVPDPGQEVPFFIKLRERSADKLRVAMHQAKRYSVPNSRDQEATLSGWPTALLYVRRPLRLAREYGSAPFKRIFKGVFQWKCWT
jgi:Uncharacterised nucleotidyltransferase